MTATTTSSANVRVELQSAVARLVINRPPLNILDLATIQELRAGLQELTGRPDVRLVEIRGAGDKAFSAGTDVRDHFPGRAAEMLHEFHALVRAVLSSPVPTVAVVFGHCLGGGLELALCCDFVLAAVDARLGLPEIKLGAFPPVAASLLAQVVGNRKALEMILTGETIAADQAWWIGLVNRMAGARELPEEAEKFERELLAHSRPVLELARKAARLGSFEDFETRLREAERIYLEELLPTADASEGLNAFLEKRAPQWKNR